MDKQTRKRQWFESAEEYRKSSNIEELEVGPAKRLCEDSNWGYANVFSEIISQMDNEEVAFPEEEIEEEMVVDMMKMLEEEIMPCRSCRDEESTNNSASDDRHDIALHGEEESVNSGYSGESVNSWDECYASNVELQYLLGASDEYLSIPGSSQSDFVHTVNGYNYDYEFFETEAEQQVLLQNWLAYNESHE